MAVTKTDIVNLAATHLGERRYTDPFTDTSPTAELLSFRYDFSRKEVLRSHTWGCAKKDTSLSEDETNPRAGNYNPRLQEQIDFMKEQGMYGVSPNTGLNQITRNS